MSSARSHPNNPNPKPTPAPNPKSSGTTQTWSSPQGVVTVTNGPVVIAPAPPDLVLSLKLLDSCKSLAAFLKLQEDALKGAGENGAEVQTAAGVRQLLEGAEMDFAMKDVATEPGKQQSILYGKERQELQKLLVVGRNASDALSRKIATLLPRNSGSFEDPWGVETPMAPAGDPWSPNSSPDPWGGLSPSTIPNDPWGPAPEGADVGSAGGNANFTGGANGASQFESGASGGVPGEASGAGEAVASNALGFELDTVMTSSSGVTSSLTTAGDGSWTRVTSNGVNVHIEGSDGTNVTLTPENNSAPSQNPAPNNATDTPQNSAPAPDNRSNDGPPPPAPSPPSPPAQTPAPPSAPQQKGPSEKGPGEDPSKEKDNVEPAKGSLDISFAIDTSLTDNGGPGAPDTTGGAELSTAEMAQQLLDGIDASLTGGLDLGLSGLLDLFSSVTPTAQPQQTSPVDAQSNSLGDSGNGADAAEAASTARGEGPNTGATPTAGAAAATAASASGAPTKAPTPPDPDPPSWIF
jgi:hypothetical protein